METAAVHRISEDLDIRVITAPYFLATKLEAFQGRGESDLFASKDLEDVVTVLDGRPTIVAEIRRESAELSVFLQEAIGRLTADPRFADAISGYLLPDAVSQARITLVLERMHQLSTL